MLLVDTSVWVDHLRKGDDALVSALEQDAVVIHPHVVGELALGNFKDRLAVLALLRNLPQAIVATNERGDLWPIVQARWPYVLPSCRPLAVVLPIGSIGRSDGDPFILVVPSANL